MFLVHQGVTRTGSGLQGPLGTTGTALSTSHCIKSGRLRLRTHGREVRVTPPCAKAILQSWRGADGAAGWGYDLILGVVTISTTRDRSSCFSLTFSSPVLVPYYLRWLVTAGLGLGPATLNEPHLTKIWRLVGLLPMLGPQGVSSSMTARVLQGPGMDHLSDILSPALCHRAFLWLCSCVHNHPLFSVPTRASLITTGIILSSHSQSSDTCSHDRIIPEMAERHSTLYNLAFALEEM